MTQKIFNLIWESRNGFKPSNIEELICLLVEILTGLIGKNDVSDMLYRIDQANLNR
jgi:hypothetical protein